MDNGVETDEDALISILGKDAYYSTDFKVTDNVRVLAHTVSNKKQSAF